ncbi:MAG: RNA polymerase sigma factor WhiG [Acidimicrobiia bacterium]
MWPRPSCTLTSPGIASGRSIPKPIPVPEAPAVDDASFIEGLWREYKDSSRKDLRDRLILHYSPLVKFVAGRVAVGLPHNVEQADLVSYGIFGLMDAIDKYDPARGYKFETYAMSRIKGAIIDELRTIDWVPRSVRAKARAIERAYAKLEGELHRTPEEHEVVAELEMTKDQFAQTLSQISLVGIVPLDELLSGSDPGDGGGQSTLADTIADGTDDPVEAYEVQEIKHILAEAIKGMPERERLVLNLYYYNGLTLAEIGEVLGVTESRVCQIHTKGILQLRSRLLEPERGLAG